MISILLSFGFLFKQAGKYSEEPILKISQVLALANID